ncbi:carbonic anhydrase [Tothia fuscella]|uniref:Carbonic anhydrase n=1 Tax=Tothia fuscella TaxID=1048955 RepID=A0A9P4TXW9_9PEZI|nr:carbonic anhydrase [Tothia fuscella]
MSTTATVTCSDPRVIPEHYLKIGRGEAAVIRNAGGRVSDAMRSLAALDALGNTGTVMVVHHTDCGMTHMSDSGVKKMLRERAPERSAEIDDMEFGQILEYSIKEDLNILRESPYLSTDLNILGYNLDIHTGLLTEVK